MISLENEILEEKLLEAFEKAISTDKELKSFLAHQVLSGWDIYGYDFLGERVLFNEQLEEIFDLLREEFFNDGGTNFDIRELSEIVYDMEIGQEPDEDY